MNFDINTWLKYTEENKDYTDQAGLLGLKLPPYSSLLLVSDKCAQAQNYMCSLKKKLYQFY